MAAVDAEDLDKLIIRWAEPVRQLGVELGGFAGSHGDVVLAQDQSHLARRTAVFVPVETFSAVSAGLRTDALANCAAPSRSIGRSASGLRVRATCLMGPT